MQLKDFLRLVLKSAVIGLAIAFVVVLLRPDLMQGDRPVVEFRENTGARTDDGAVPGVGPVSYADAVARAAPAVVNIHTSKLVTRSVHPFFDDPLLRRFFGEGLTTPRQQLQTNLGSGVIVSTQGYILTNNHVIEGADEIQVMLADGRSVQAALVGSDPDTDLAVLRIPLEELPSITLAMADPLRVGDVVLAIGNPFGVGQTVTYGIVSATGRNRLGLSTFEDFIQTDAAINPGNSGGALVNPRGELIGINTAIFSRSGGSQGIGFAIPITLARGVMQQIIEQGKVVRGWLGIETQDVTPELAQSFGLVDTTGVLVAGVLRNGPADRAGLRPGDILTHIDERKVADASAALNLIVQYAPGSSLRIDGIRNGETFTTKAEVVQRPQQQ